jgi:hypothetical protein
MSLLIRMLLAVAGAIAALLVARDAGNFSVVQGIVALFVVAAVVIGVGLLGRRR